MATIYALYKGDNLIDTGTVYQLAKRRNVKVETIQFYGSPTYQKRVKGGNGLCLVKIE